MKISCATFLVIVSCWGIQAFGASSQIDNQGKATYQLYELYSWEDANHSTWNFSILYNTSREKSVKEVFDKKTTLRGVDSLKKKILSMPPGSKIIWMDELLSNGVKQKGSGGLKYPPDNILEEVKQFAQEHGVEVVGAFTAGEI
jgi:hypothetical protein